MNFEEAQAKVAESIRARISGYDGNMSYVRYFEDQAAIAAFEEETGYRVEILYSPSDSPEKPKFTARTETTATGTYLNKPFELHWIDVDCSYEVEGDFTDEERAVIATVFEVSSVLS